MKIIKLIKNAINHLFKPQNVPNSVPTPKISETRDIFSPVTRDLKTPQNTTKQPLKAFDNPPPHICPYCQSKKIVKKGVRKKKYETQQIYLCTECNHKFTPQKVKGKQFPLKVILDGISFYNIGWTLEESCGFLKSKFGLEVKPSTLSDWVKEFEPLCRYARMRDQGLKLFSPRQVIQSVKLYHRQVFNFLYHRAKIALILQDFKHSKYEPLREFLDLISVECPHQLFNNSPRMSELKISFNLSEVVIREKNNFACKIADLVLQAVQDNKLRHETLGQFMIANDSVTVACEVPVYIDSTDIEHMQNNLGFLIPFNLQGLETITGHIDILQIRNGEVHILDYKPNAKKEKPIEQLTLYALALSRLTGLRLFNIKCAWFDEKSYFEFFPLHVVLKRNKIKYKEDPRQLKFEYGLQIQSI